MKGYLPNIELRFYFVFSVVLYMTMMYNIQILSNASLSAYNLMDDGWKIFNRKVDNYDSEWQVFKELIANYWYWFAIHIICTEIFRFTKFKNISLLYFIIGAFACFKIYNMRFFLALITQTVICYGVSTVFKRKTHIWVLTSIWLVILNSLKFESYFQLAVDTLDVEESKVHDFLVIFAWCILKNVSFNLERISCEEKDKEKFTFTHCLGYMFYFPSFHCGPTVIYSRYMSMLDYLNASIDKEYNLEMIKTRSKHFMLQMLRFFGWFVITEIGLHFFYIHYIVMSKSLKSVNIFALFGLGFLNGQFFNNKYIIQYGIPIAFGEFENIPMPSTPRCICRVHKYSDMWKWFDNGLYEFLFKYIYTKMTTRSSTVIKKIFSSFITFFFIYIWHGFFDYILIWSIANCVCIVVEKFVYDFIESESFNRKALKVIKTENNLHRLRAYIGAHILIPDILSNFFFFGGTHFGMEFITRTYTNGLWNYFKISGTIFLLYPIAEAIKRYEQQRDSTKKKIIY
ncbi:hypothetical protein ACKWTF_008402 [Chironomus riparius]